ncbi:MAG: VWA domain-containing protein [Phycisphaerae bacterium]
MNLRLITISLAASAMLLVAGCPPTASDSTTASDLFGVFVVPPGTTGDNQGAQGAPGAPGARGEQGPAGAAGAQGPAGAAGANGTNGQDGADGNSISAVADAGGALTVTGGQVVHLDGSHTFVQSGSQFTVSDMTFAWSQVDQSGINVPIQNADQAIAQIVVPSDAGLFLLQFRLKVTDPDGFVSQHDVLLLVNNPGLELGSIGFVGSDAPDFGPTSGDFTLAVAVSDLGGNPLTNLSAANFSFRDVKIALLGDSGNDATAAAIDTVLVPPTAGTPTNTVLVFDSSSSMAAMDRFGYGRRSAGNAFVDTLTGGDDFVAVTDFGPPPTFGASRLIQDFTSDAATIRSSLFQLAEGGPTPIWQAALDAMTLLSTRSTQGGVIVLTTDGQADDSQLLWNVISQANSQGVRIFTVGMGDNLDFRQLRDAAVQTGGMFTEAADAIALVDAFAGVGAGANDGFIKVQAKMHFPAIFGQCRVHGEMVIDVGSSTAIVPFAFTTYIIGDGA